MKATPLRASVIIALLTGCGGPRYPLSEVPIVGGSDSARREVEAALAEFDAWIGVGRLEIAEVRFGTTEAGTFGKFERPSFRITLSEEDVDVIPIRQTLRHELCHALDFSEDLAEERPALLDRIAEELYSGLPGTLAPHWAGSERSRRSEAMAQFCEKGPFAAAALSVPCPSEPPDATAVATWLVDTVWAGWDPPESPTPMGRAHATWEAPRVPSGDQFNVSWTEDPDVINVLIGSDDLWDNVQLELHTGSEFIGDYQRPVDDPEDPPEGVPPGGYVSPLLGWPEGPGAGLMGIHVRPFGNAEQRVIWSGGEDWAVVPDGCLSSTDGALFATDDAIWLAWVDGMVVNWAPIGE